MSEAHGHWARVAHTWSLTGPPLRPAAPDLACFEQALAAWQATAAVGTTPEALILGVTPELCEGLSWPPGTRVSALDRSRDMIEAVWPGARDRARIGAWTDMPFADASCDIILCDGGFGLLSLDDQRRLLHEVARVLAPGGVFVVRLFAPMGRTGCLDEIAADLHARRIASLDQLKLRLWGALQTSAATGVQPRDVVAQIDAMSDGGRFLVEQLGWNAAHVDRLHVHRDSPARYHLTEASGLAAMVAAVPSLRELSVAWPASVDGPCCPVVSLRRR